MLNKGNKSTPKSVTVDTTSGGILLSDAGAWKTRTFTNTGSVTVYLGKSGVTTAIGSPLAANASMSDDVSLDAWYGITGSSTADVRVVEVQ
jgi:hypothetical protein